MKPTSALLLAAGLSSAAAQQSPRVRLLNLPTAASKSMFGNVTNVRQLPSGGLLVNDNAKRQVLLLDPTLTNAAVVLDSTTAGNSYGPRGGSLIPYGDSTLFVDAASLSMLVLSPAGAIARVISVPRSQDAMYLVNPVFGQPGFDAQHRLVYRATIRPKMPVMNMGSNNREQFVMPELPDSAAIVRIDLATRKSDTVAYIRVARQKMNITRTDNGVMATTEINPMPVVDDWAVLSDGTIAIVRGRQYRVDFVGADDRAASSPKIPYDWQRLSDDEKVAVIDSAKAAYERMRAAGATGTTGAAGRGGDAGMGAIGFSTSTRVVIAAGGGADGARAAVDGARGGAGGGLPPATFVSASELPDYRPVFAGASPLRGDADGNLWVRTTATRAGTIAGPIYDVINGKGELIDRVQVPAGRTIVGFGTGGVVYLASRDDAGVKIEKATTR